MHVGGQMFCHATSHTPSIVLNKFYNLAKQFILEKAKETYSDIEKIRRQLLQNKDPFYSELGFRCQSADDEFKIILLQATRIACVMHDLGHFPFSHTVEKVLTNFSAEMPNSNSRENIQKAFAALPKKDHLHEAIGRALMKHIFTSFSDGNLRDFAILCFAIAEEITEESVKDSSSTKAPNPIISCLHSIVSSDLDADRFDYVRRDGVASAFDFGDFDLERILHTLRIEECEKAFKLLPTTVALSAVESFFLERYQCYRWLVFHPTAVQVDVALSRALTILLEVACGEKDNTWTNVKQILEHGRINRLWQPFQLACPDKFIDCDEPWLITILREIQQAIPDDLSNQSLEKLALRTYLDLILDRKKRLRHLWKRQEDYEIFCKEVVNNLREKPPGNYSQHKEPIVTFNDCYLPGLSRKDITVARLRKLEEQLQKKINEQRKKSDQTDAHLPEIGLLIHRLNFCPYKKAEVVDLHANNQICAADKLSPIIRNLEAAWREDIQLRIYYWFRNKIDDGTENYQLIADDDLKDIDQQKLLKWVAEACANVIGGDDTESDK